MDFHLDYVCINGFASGDGARRYGLAGDGWGEPLVYAAKADLLIPADADIRDCPVSVRLKSGAKLYRQPTGDALIDELDTSVRYFGADRVCIAVTGSRTSAARRYGIVDPDSGLVNYVAEEDLVILPEDGIRKVCSDYAQIKSGAKLYSQPDGDTNVAQPNKQFYPGGDIDPDEVCFSVTESGTSGEFWYGLYDVSGESRDGLVYVNEPDVQMPLDVPLIACEWR